MKAEYEKAELIINDIINNIPLYDKTQPGYEKRLFTYIYVKLSTLLEYDDKACELIEANLGGYNRDKALDEIIYPASDLRALARGKALCSGFAVILKEVLSRVGIKSIIVLMKEEHEWNQVYLDGIWYNCDLTNDYDFILSNLKCPYFLQSNNDNPNFKKYQPTVPYMECLVTISEKEQEQLIEEALSYVNKKEEKEEIVEKLSESLPKKILNWLNHLKKEERGRKR